MRADSQVGLNFKGPRKCGVFSKVLQYYTPKMVESAGKELCVPGIMDTRQHPDYMQIFSCKQGVTFKPRVVEGSPVHQPLY